MLLLLAYELVAAYGIAIGDHGAAGSMLGNLSIL